MPKIREVIIFFFSGFKFNLVRILEIVDKEN